MNLRIITKNHVADPEIGFQAKSISKSDGCATAMSTAWELTWLFISQRGRSFQQKKIGKKIVC